jgi:hypothetical protein
MGKTYTKEELKEILKSHELWRLGDKAGIRANLSSADLSSADLSSANLRGADLRGANLYSANLYGANLYGANLRGAINFYFSLVPEKGSFTAFKKVFNNGIEYVLELEIPKSAKRVSTPIGRKCRASQAKAIAAYNQDGTKTKETIFYSQHDPEFKYQIGKIAKVDNFDNNIRVGCTSGIHFFITFEEAKNY